MGIGAFFNPNADFEVPKCDGISEKGKQSILVERHVRKTLFMASNHFLSVVKK